MVRHRSRQVGRRSVLIAAAVSAGAVAGGVGGGYLLTDRERRPRLFGWSMDGSSPESVGTAVLTAVDLDRKPQALNFFMAWEWEAPFPRRTVEAIAMVGALPEITWEPWDPRLEADQPKFGLGALSAYDEYVDAFARGCAEYGEPLYLRFGHEMNSDWYPWSVMANGGSPQAFIDAYRRLYDRFQAAGATNVEWVWCPNIIYRDRPDLIVDSYPGDDVVDVIAVDGYNRGGWSPQDVFAATFDVLNGISKQKPLWINETGTIPEGKDLWIPELFSYLETTRVDALLWFELQTDTTPDWRMLATPETTEAAQRSLRTW